MVNRKDGGDGTQRGCEDKPQAERKGDGGRGEAPAIGGEGGPTEDVNEGAWMEAPEDKGLVLTVIKEEGGVVNWKGGGYRTQRGCEDKSRAAPLVERGSNRGRQQGCGNRCAKG